MNAKSKFQIPILQGTRPEVGLFSSTVAAPSLRDASSLVSGVSVSNHPIITTSITNNNSVLPSTIGAGLGFGGVGGFRYLYPGTNAGVAERDILYYLNSSKKTIQLYPIAKVTGSELSEAMVKYLKTGELSGEGAASLFVTTTNSQPLGSNDGFNINNAAELYDCDPSFGSVREVTLSNPGSDYFITGVPITVRAVNLTPNAISSGKFILVNITVGGGGLINSGTTVISNTHDIPLNSRLTVEDGQVSVIPGVPLVGGTGYFNGTISNTENVVINGENVSRQSGGQGLQLLVTTAVNPGPIVFVNILNNGSGYNNGDIVRVISGNNDALVQITTVDKTPSTNIPPTLAVLNVSNILDPGSGAPLVPYDSYTVESIILPNGQKKSLELNSEENICKSKVPKARIFTAGGQLAYYPQISSGLHPSNWIVGNGASLCANPSLCLPVNITN